MKISICIYNGLDKNQSEDTAFCNDSLVEKPFYKIETICLQCVGVADGVGGNAGGRDASIFIASQISQTDFSQMTEDTIRHFATMLNEELIHYASTMPGKTEMATTLTCVVAASDGYYLIHAGNTRLYVMQGSYLKQLTTDHTTYNWLMECGQYEAAEQCNKSEINCCFGGGTSRYARRLVVDKLFDDCPDTLVLTSDGIHEFVDIDSIEDALATSESDCEAVKSITDIAIKNGSTDDKTIVIVRR